MFDSHVIHKKGEFLWEIPTSFRAGMRVPADIYASEAMLAGIAHDRSLEQLVNVAMLPGIQKYAIAMPDAHEGYGFPIGGVAAFDRETGVISPGGIGYDINCGVRLLRTSLDRATIKPFLRDLGHAIFDAVPSGVGRTGRLHLTGEDLDQVLARGAERMAELGYAAQDDLLHIESGGVLHEADPSLVSFFAKARGSNQLGTMGAGNHFVEVGYVETIFDEIGAKELGLTLDQVTVLIHTGSRGLGHQVATDYIRIMNRTMAEYGIQVPDRELACAPFSSKDGQSYFKAMAAAANFAWANRQFITYEVRQAFANVFGSLKPTLSLVYDVAHNIAKVEKHRIGDGERELVVHRKGATRAFPGQPVLIPGSMGTASYVLLGQEAALEKSFGSSCHGAGRRMSRTETYRHMQADDLYQELFAQGIIINAGSKRGLVEEAPFAYKDIDEVVNVVHGAGIAKKVARLRPLVVVKG